MGATGAGSLAPINTENSILVLTATNETKFNQTDFEKAILSVITPKITTEKPTTTEQATTVTTAAPTTQEPTTTEQATTVTTAAPTTQEPTTTEQATTVTTSAPTTQEPTTTEQATTVTTVAPTTQEPTTTEQATTVTTAAPTTQEPTTTEQATTVITAAPTTQEPTTSEQAATTTPAKATTEEAATTEQAKTTTTAEATTEESTTSEQAATSTPAKATTEEPTPTEKVTTVITAKPTSKLPATTVITDQPEVATETLKEEVVQFGRSLKSVSETFYDVAVEAIMPENKGLDLAVEFYALKDGVRIERDLVDALLRESTEQLQQELNASVIVVKYSQPPTEKELSAVDLSGVSEQNFDRFGFRAAVAESLNKPATLLLSKQEAGDKYSLYDVYITEVKVSGSGVNVMFYVAESSGHPVPRDNLDNAVKNNIDDIAKQSAADSGKVLPRESGGLSTVEIVFIVLGTLLGVVILAAVGFVAFKKYKSPYDPLLGPRGDGAAANARANPSYST